MPRLTSLTFEHDRSRYFLEFDLDDTAIMNEQLSVDVTAKVVDRHGREFKEVLTVVLDFSNMTAQLLRGKQLIKTINLKDLIAKQETWDENGPDEESEGPLADSFGDAVEELIGSIPVPDPILGCLIKAGVSAIIGQAIRCNERLDVRGAGQRVRAIARCLMQSAGGIFSRAAWRAARCVVTFGFS